MRKFYSKIVLILAIFLLGLGGCKKFGFMFSPNVTSDFEYTSNKAPTWRWNKVPGAKFYEYKLGAEGTWTNNGDLTEFTLPPEMLYEGADGEYTLFVRSNSGDEENPFSEEKSFTVIIDTTPPAAPEVTGYVTSTNSVTPAWTWSQVEDAKMYAFAFSEDGPWSEVPASVVSYRSTKPMADGEYRFYIKAKDRAGNESVVSQSAKITIIDSTGFISPIVSPGTAGIEIKEGENLVKVIIGTSRPTWNWRMELESADLEKLGAYRYQVNGQRDDKWILVDTGVSALGSYTPNSNLSAGLQTLYVQAGEILGAGLYNWSAVGSFTYEIDLTPPPKPLVLGEVSTLSRPTWSWNVSSEAVALKFSLMPGDFSDDPTGMLASAAWIPDIADEDGDGNTTETIWNVDKLSYSPTAALPGGKYSLVVLVQDSVGNWSEAGYCLTEVVSMSTDSPTVTTVSKSPTNDATPVWEWQISGEFSAFRIQLDGEDSSSWTILSADKNSYTPENSMSEGLHTLFVQALPLGINLADATDTDWTDSGSSLVVIDLTPPPAPNIVGVRTTGSRRPAWSWNKPDNSVVAFSFKLSHAKSNGGGGYDIDEGAWLNGDATLMSFSPVSDLDASSDQNLNYYAMEVRAADSVGNWSETAVYVTQIRTDFPESPIVTGDAYTANKMPTWTFRADYQNFQYQLDSQSGAWSTFTSADTSAPFTGTFTPSSELMDGSHVLYVKVKNEFNTWSGPGFSMITVDTTGPDAPVVSGPALSGSRRPTWSWLIPEGTAGFRYQLDGEIAGNWTEVAENIQLYTPSTDLVVAPAETGTFTLYVQAKDNLDNWGNSGTFTININTAGGANPVVTGTSPTANPTPTWSWQAVTGAVSYRWSMDNPLGPWNNTNELSYTSPFPLTGEHTLYVQAKNNVGNWSESGSFLINIDSTPPEMPVVESKASQTGDKTPTWWWNSIPDAFGYRYQLDSQNASGWTDVDATVLTYTVSSDLPEGGYTLYVQARDEIGNWSDSGSYFVTVDYDTQNFGLPDKVVLRSISKGIANDAIRLTWEKLVDATVYKIYRFNQADLDNGDKVGSLIATVDITSDPSGGITTSGDAYFYDQNSVDTELSYYYRVSGINDDGEGLKSDFFANISSSVELAKGSVLGKPLNVNAERSGSDFEFALSWDAVVGATSYILFRSGPYSEVQTEENLQWQYLVSPDSSTWVDYDDSVVDLDEIRKLSAISYIDSDNVKEMNYYYYKVIAVNADSQADILYANEGVLNGNFFISDAARVRGFLLPLYVNGWLTASDNLHSTLSDYGKIKLTVTVPTEYQPYLKDLEFEVKRTYRYGGGHQGMNATTADRSSHTSLVNPSPLSGSWDKTITLEYNFDGATFSGGTKSQYDTLYDVNSAGEKLFAGLNKNSVQTDDSYPWYEKTQAYMDSEGNWDKIVDLDGTPSEMEWHYLKWDWVVRKALGHQGNPLKNKPEAERFDIELMTRCDYQLIMKHKDPEIVSESIGETVYGWPALTPREFLFMGAFFREVVFYKLEIAHADEIEELMSAYSIAQLKADRDSNGWIGGSIHVRDAKVDLINFAAAAHLYTEKGSNTAHGISDFPGIEIELDWNPLNLLLGGEMRESLVGDPIYIYTPKWSGTIYLNAFVYGGTYYHGVDSRAYAKIDYAEWTKASGKISEIMPSSHAYQGTHQIIQEYLNDGATWNRASGNSATTYFDRYTSVGWSYGSRSYPGFN